VIFVIFVIFAIFAIQMNLLGRDAQATQIARYTLPVIATTPVAAIPDEARCLGCDYALRGLASDRRPECGRRFDP
jgi:hypothetical protein